MQNKILEYNVYSGTLRECCDDIVTTISHSNKKTWLACLNPHSFVVANEVANFKYALQSADWLVPDGIGIVFASRLLGAPVSERISGPDIFNCINTALNQYGGVSVFFLGSTENVLNLIHKQMTCDWPAINVIGLLSPPFKEVFTQEDNELIIEKINSYQPDVLWVGLSAPKQEQWILENIHRLDVKFVGAVGAVFDFYSGNVKRSHPVFQKLGLEWLPRLLRQPRRLWRRMFVSAPIFVLHVLAQKFRTIIR